MVVDRLEYGLGYIALRPNRSANWTTNKRIILILGGFTLTVAMSWSLVGLWMVLPFAGLEVALLAFFLIRVCQRTYRQQIIRFTRDQICIESGMHQPRQTWLFDKATAHVVLIKPRHALDGPAFLIGHAESMVEVGSFLNKDDREKLHRLFRTTGLTVKIRDAEPKGRLKA